MARSKTTWRQGESGNPMGRPKQNETISELLRLRLFDKYNRNKRNVDNIVSKLITLAISGNLQAIKIVFERIDGNIKDLPNEEYINNEPIDLNDIKKELKDLLRKGKTKKFE